MTQAVSGKMVSFARGAMVTIRIVRLLAIAMAMWLSCDAIAGKRGVRRLSDAMGPAAIGTFKSSQSAALFVGVRRFPDDTTIAEVHYAVDDAVDLATVLALNEKVQLIDPARVILALSGDPQKPESKQNLERLVAAGAKVRAAGESDILNALDEQAGAAGRDGILVIAFATHGVSYDGTQYLFNATSVLRHRETTLSESKIREIASRSDAARSFILVDACRERLRDDQRSGGSDLRSAASLVQAMSNVHGQVVLSAAAAGQYAYDDDVRRNGVFTAAVIDGLQCGASTNERGFITADTLATFVEARVLTWIKKHRDADVVRATQLTSDGDAKNMPLASCHDAAHDAKPAACMIAIRSSPIKATVRIDGKEIGATPLSIPLGQGRHAKVELVKSGYAPAITEVDCRSQPVFIILQSRSVTPQVLLSDEFDDNRNNWYISADSEAPAGIENGVYVLGSKAFEFRFTSVGPRMDPDADFKIAATARRLRGGQGNHFGLVWGLADRSNFFYFSINGEGNVEIGVSENGRVSLLNDITNVNPNVRRDTSVDRLKIVKVGKRIRLFVNDALVHDMEFRPFFGPGIGFAAFNGPIVAEFDDLKVEGSPTP